MRPYTRFDYNSGLSPNLPNFMGVLNLGQFT